MEANDKLARSNTGLQVTEKSSLTLQEKSLLSELDLTATNAKVALEPRIGKEFLRVLAEFPAEAIESAFRAWRDDSPFFPAISDIKQLAQQWVRLQAEARQEAERAARRREVEAARERGEILEWPDVIAKFNDIVSRETAATLEEKGKMPEVPPQAEIVISEDRREMIRQQCEQVRKRYGVTK